MSETCDHVIRVHRTDKPNRLFKGPRSEVLHAVEDELITMIRAGERPTSIEFVAWPNDVGDQDINYLIARLNEETKILKWQPCPLTNLERSDRWDNFRRLKGPRE